MFDFIAQPWPRWWTGFDLLSNLIGYVPLGALVFIAMVRSSVAAPRAWLLALLIGGVLSLSLETLQNFLPRRIPSNVDLVLNVAGAALGASLGAWVYARGGVARWQALRDRWLTRRSAGGIALLAAWPVALLFPLPLPLGVGTVLAPAREALLAFLQDTALAGVAADWLAADKSPSVIGAGGEWLVIALGLLAPCLIAYSITPPSWRRWLAAAVLGGVGVAATTLSTALNFGPEHALAWATPRALAALAVAFGVAGLLAWLPRRAVAAAGLMALTALVVLVAQAPADPYFAQRLQAWEQGRFIRFHGAAQWVGWLWPYAAIAHLLTMTSLRPERVPPRATPDSRSAARRSGGTTPDKRREPDRRSASRRR